MQGGAQEEKPKVACCPGLHTKADTPESAGFLQTRRSLLSVYFVLALRLLWDGNRRRASRFAQMITSPGSAIIYVSRRIFSA